MTTGSADDRFLELQRQTARAQRLAGIGSWEWDVAADHITWSDELYRIFGVDPESFEASYQAYMECVHPDDRDAIQAVVQETFETAAPYEIRHRIQRPDGTVLHVQSQGAAETQDGQVVRLYGIAHDVTDQENARIAHDVKDRFFELSQDMLCVASTTGFFLELNPAWEDVLGWSLEELKAKPYVEFVHPDDRDATLREAERLAAPDALAAAYENRYQAKDGSYHRLRWSASSDARAGHIYGVARDVTQERSQQARFEAFLDSAPDAMILVGAEGRIDQVNAQTVEMFGYPDDELKGQPVEMLVPEAARGAHPSHRAKYEAHPEQRPMGMGRELHAQCKDGSLIPVEISLSPVEVEGEHLVIAAVRDISQRKQMEEDAEAAREQRQQIERLEEVTRFKTQLLNTASHELNTPITPLRMQLHLLATETMGPLTDRQKRSVEMLKRNVNRLSTLVADVLDVARLESGKLRITPEEMELDPVLAEVHDMFNAQADASGIDLQLGPATAARLEADRDRLMQVVINFISNAIKFTPEAGVVRLSASAQRSVVRVEVTDTGRGLTAGERKRLFQAFSQIHEPGETTETGTGLGLYIARGIIEQHGGRIGVDSGGLGKGATFWFELPTS